MTFSFVKKGRMRKALSHVKPYVNVVLNKRQVICSIPKRMRTSTKPCKPVNSDKIGKITRRPALSKKCIIVFKSCLTFQPVKECKGPGI